MRQNILIVLMTFVLVTRVSAQTLPPCAERPHYVDNPWVNARLFCLELLVEDNSAGELAFTALTVAPDGTLYAARPLAGQVFAIEDTDADALPDTARLIAENLILPNGLEFYDGKLYIAGGSQISVYDPETGATDLLTEDVPTGGGFWTGDLTVGADGRIYVTTGAGGDNDALRGSVMSYALDGTDRQWVASGSIEPIGIAFQNETLWVVDSTVGLMRVSPKGIIESAMTFHPDSRPAMLAPYTGDALPSLENTLLLVLRGSSDQVDLQGFAVVAINPDTSDYTLLIPAESETQATVGFTLKEMNYRMSGFWPHHPLGVAVSPEGWVYVSVGGGRIMALRPQL